MSRTSDEQKIDHQIALPNIRNYPDSAAPMDSENNKDDDDDDERLDVVGTTDSHSDAAHGEFYSLTALGRLRLDFLFMFDIPCLSNTVTHG